MKIRVALVAAALLLTLTGCSEAPANAGDERTAPAASESAAPLVAETTEPLPDETASADEQYLTDVRKALTNGRETSIPNASDAQLVEAGKAACQQIAGGTPESDVRVVEGEVFDENWGAYQDSATILVIAQSHYC